jgi:hypothetical protein
MNLIGARRLFIVLIVVVVVSSFMTVNGLGKTECQKVGSGEEEPTGGQQHKAQLSIPEFELAMNGEGI